MAIEKDNTPDFFDPADPETWVKESPTEPGQSVAVAMLGEASLVQKE
jgi:hypothetical protein